MRFQWLGEVSGVAALHKQTRKREGKTSFVMSVLLVYI